MDSKLLALTAAVGMVLFALGPGVATVAADSAGNDTLSVGVSQAGNQGATVTVTDNGTAVEGANVTVEAGENESYVGEGDYVTDENGTVDLPAPGETVNVTVTATAHDETATTTATLTADESQPVGHGVSAFVQYLLENGATGIGPEVSEYVTQHNPGNAPDHAGAPDDVGPDEDRRGPPEDAGAQSEDNETERGPPEDRGPGADDADTEDTEEEEETEETETEEETDDDEDGESGPSDGANGNAKGR